VASQSLKSENSKSKKFWRDSYPRQISRPTSVFVSKFTTRRFPTLGWRLKSSAGTPASKNPADPALVRPPSFPNNRTALLDPDWPRELSRRRQTNRPHGTVVQ